MASIREYFQTLNGATIEPSQLLQAGNDVFLNESAVADGETLHKIAEFYRSIHATSYGQAIPNTHATASHTTTATNDFEAVVEVTTNNQVIQPTAINVSNAGLAPVNIVLGVGSIGFQEALVSPGQTYYLDPSQYPQLIKNGGLFVNQLDGSAGEITVNVAYHLVVQ